MPLSLCNDREVLGPWVNKPWLNAVAAIIVGLLVVLSLILAATTLFPNLDAITMAGVLGNILVVSLAVMGIVALAQLDKETWQMPPLAELTRPPWSVTRKIGMFMLRAYLFIAVILLVVKTVQLAIGH